jgi:hypothetical protein
MFENPETAILHIPKLVGLAEVYRDSTENGRYAILEAYREVIDYQKAILFYFKLVSKPNELISFDAFNWIPLIYDEVEMLATYANTFDTEMFGKITLLINSQQVKYTP